jgi:hypothetical protein
VGRCLVECLEEAVGKADRMYRLVPVVCQLRWDLRALCRLVRRLITIDHVWTLGVSVIQFKMGFAISDCGYDLVLSGSVGSDFQGSCTRVFKNGEFSDSRAVPILQWVILYSLQLIIYLGSFLRFVLCTLLRSIRSPSCSIILLFCVR